VVELPPIPAAPVLPCDVVPPTELVVGPACVVTAAPLMPMLDADTLLVESVLEPPAPVVELPGPGGAGVSSPLQPRGMPASVRPKGSSLIKYFMRGWRPDCPRCRRCRCRRWLESTW